MVCPFGTECVTSVIDSRKNSEGIRRRRECSTCGLRFTTYEKADINLMVQKNSGDIEEFSYEKLYQGIENAFGGIDISDKKLKTLVDNVYKEIKTHGKKVKSAFSNGKHPENSKTVFSNGAHPENTENSKKKWICVDPPPPLFQNSHIFPFFFFC